MLRSILVAFALLFAFPAQADPSAFAKRLCAEQPNNYMCVTVRIKGAKRQYAEWTEKFPNPVTRRIAMLINRRNTLIWNGHTIALPMVFTNDILDYAPFPREKAWFGPKHVVVDLNKLAWAAYEPIPGQNLRARLVRWGVANGGSKICKETGRLECKTHPGTHAVLKLHNASKRSDLYPVDCANKKSCGHPMPYYMPFHRDGTGLHGDKWLVGRNASHGCVRMMVEDARWLNRQFAYAGMPVVVEDY